MRYIVVPETIVLEPIADLLSAKELAEAKPEPLPFRKYALHCWLNDGRAIATFVKQVRWAKVVDLFIKAAPGTVIVLEDEDYTTLRTIVESPMATTPALVAVRVLAYPLAVLGATTDPPEPKAA